MAEPSRRVDEREHKAERLVRMEVVENNRIQVEMKATLPLSVRGFTIRIEQIEQAEPTAEASPGAD